MHFSLVIVRLLVLVFVSSSFIAGLAQSPSLASKPNLPQRVGTFQAQGPAKNPSDGVASVSDLHVDASGFHVLAGGEREYDGPDGQRYRVIVTNTASPSAAYSILTFPRRVAGHNRHNLSFVSGLGVVSSLGPGLSFVKGHHAVTVETLSESGDREAVLEFGRTFASSIDGDPGIVPELVFHMPEWEKKYVESGPAGIGYAVSGAAMQALLKTVREEQPIVDAIPFEGGTEAVTARYDHGRLMIVEFTTPQYAADADKTIIERIAQLNAESKPVPTAYRRVGNYSVFVFNAPDAATADQLLATVKYEKDVRWLGRNPHEDEIAILHYTNTMTGVIVTVLKTTVLAIVACLGFGALIGGLVFLRRRAGATANEVYSDAGGMVRLDLLDDAHVPSSSANLVRSTKD